MAQVWVTLLPTGNRNRLAAEIALPDRTSQFFIEADVGLAQDATPWLAPALPMAMRAGVGVEIRGAVDRLALANTEHAQRVLMSWFDDLSRVMVSTESVSSSHARATGVGCFFSGGVDSFYSVLKNRDRITHLIFVHGFDIHLGNEDLGMRALKSVRAAAGELGIPLIAVRTSIRDFGEGTLDWGTHRHGAVMACVGLALAEVVGHVIVPSSYAQQDLHPWGSHPDLDVLWSSSTVTFEHDGTEATRPTKIRTIAGSEAALRHLRVCFENRDNAFNCGGCEKCLRTMINLATCGALIRCATLPSEIELSRVRRLYFTHGGDLFAAENLAELRRMEVRDHRLERAIQQARAYSAVRRAALRARDWARESLTAGSPWKP